MSASINLTKGILSVVHAAHRHQTRYAINGVYIDSDGTVVGTNGKILATLHNGTDYSGITPRVLNGDDVRKLRGKLTRQTDIATLADDPRERAVPGKRQTCPDGKGKGGLCSIGSCPLCRPSPVTVEDATIRIGSKPGPFTLTHVSGPFPPYRDILPKIDSDGVPAGYTIKMQMDRTTLETITAPFAAFDPRVYWAFYPIFSDVGLRISAYATAGGALSLTLYTHPPPLFTKEPALELGMCPEYTLALCAVAKGAGIDKLTIHAKDDRSGIIMVGEGNGYQFVGMQMPLTPLGVSG